MRTLILLILAAATAGAQAAPPPPRGCPTPDHRAFDFWVGEWTVTNPAGRQAGTSRITRVLDGCAILEEWTGAGGSTGTSLNFYDPQAKAWTQTWIDNAGQPLRLAGGLRDGRMVMEAETSRGIQRVTWTPLAKDSVRQHWEQSADARKTWTTVFDGLYVRKND